MSLFLHKSHNVSVLLYHFVCPAKYRRVVFDAAVDKVVRDVCLEIAKRYEIYFLEIGIDQDHVHFLVQSVPTYSSTKIIRTIKSITAREVFRRAPHVKRQLWGGEFWSKGYYVNSVGRYQSEDVMRRYVREQGIEADYSCLHQAQLNLFDEYEVCFRYRGACPACCSFVTHLEKSTWKGWEHHGV